MEPPNVSTFANGFRHFLDSSEYSDFTIVCGEAKFSVHKVLIFSQSKVLRALCSSASKESKTSTIDLTHDGLHLVERMIEYFYSGSYPSPPSSSATAQSLLTLNIEMYALADKYDVPGLGERVIAYFKPVLATARSSAMCTPCVGLIYESTPSSNAGLRDLIVEHVVECYMADRWKRSEPLLEAAFLEAPQFGWDCFRRIQKGPRGVLSGWKAPTW